MSVTTSQPESVGTAKIRCIAGKGMFPHESAVLIKGIDRWYESMIDSELLEFESESAVGDDQPARIDVDIIDRQSGSALIELPRQVVVGGRRIWVPDSELESTN